MIDLTTATFILALAAIISIIVSAWQNRKMLEEMRKSRNKPVIVARIERSTGPSKLEKECCYDLVIKNKGREAARGIKVSYALAEMPKSKIFEWDKHVSKLKFSRGYTIEIMPLGPGDEERLKSQFAIGPKVSAIFKFHIRCQNGGEYYQEKYYHPLPEE